jgi:hypothetical protein
VTWTPTRHVTVLASYVHFFAGPFFQETPPGKDYRLLHEVVRLQILTEEGEEMNKGGR